MTQTQRSILKQKLAGKEIVVAPGIFDMISVRLADRMGFDSLYMTGYGTVASYLGEADAGLATYTDMVNRVSAFCGASKTPIICDGDTGYGGLLNVRHTVRGYEQAGVTMIQLEDQRIPKKCGHTPNRHIVSMQEMVNKIRVASDARSSADFLILARTDAIASNGLDEALRRAEAYAKAGADAIFIEAPESVDQMRKIGAAVDAPLVSNQLHGGKTPILLQAQLLEMGFAAAIYPAAGLFAAAKALASVYDDHANDRPVSAPLYSFHNFVEMIGFQDIWDFEAKYADLLKVETADSVA